VAKQVLPVEYLELTALWVRGFLGRVTVWCCEGGYKDHHETAEQWTKVFDNFLPPSPNALVPLEFNTPLCVPAGQRVGLYVHSTRPDDKAIVYDNQRGKITMQDRFMQVEPGLAHVSNVPFQTTNHWADWAWRPQREFVGRVAYGVRYILWQPSSTVHCSFPRSFRQCALTVLMAQRRPESPLSALSDDLVLYILNLCGWDWFGGMDSREDQKALPQDERHEDDSGDGWVGGYQRTLVIHELRHLARAGARVRVRQRDC
jgi:hypothetical protein